MGCKQQGKENIVWAYQLAVFTYIKEISTHTSIDVRFDNFGISTELFEFPGTNYIDFTPVGENVKKGSLTTDISILPQEALKKLQEFYPSIIKLNNVDIGNIKKIRKVKAEHDLRGFLALSKPFAVTNNHFYFVVLNLPKIEILIEVKRKNGVWKSVVLSGLQ